MRLDFARLTVRMTTRERRRVSTGFPGAMTAASASMTALADSRSEDFVGVSRYFPAARTQLSEMKVWRFMS